MVNHHEEVQGMRSPVWKKIGIGVLAVLITPILFSMTSLSAELTTEFKGERGESVTIGDGEIALTTDGFTENAIHFFNTILPSGLTVFFFIVKDDQGRYRAAANACQLCYPAQEGFRQEKDRVVCNVCGNPYPLEKIATEKGDCNPVPIGDKLETRDGKVIIHQKDLEKLSPYFNTHQ